MKIALITGASAGLGWEFALQIDASQQVDEIWLVARRKEKLEELCGLLQHSRGRVFAVDLTRGEELQTLFSALEDGDYQVQWLINNAGFGKVGAFDAVDVQTNLMMLDLNVRALTEITQRVLPYCVQGSKIVQVASTAGFAPLTNFAVYAASKAYVLNFSNALAQELKPRGITVTAVCPGPVETEFLEVATTNGVKNDVPEFLMAQAQPVVKKALADAQRGKRNSIYGASMKMFAGCSGLIPRSVMLWASERTYR